MSRKAQTLRLAASLALRIAKSRSKNALSVVTALSVIGVACGVFALTVVLAVSDGFEKAFQDRILGIYPHLMVTRTRTTFPDWREVAERIATTPGVVGVTPLSHHRMMASRGPFRAEASIQGVDPATLGGVIDLAAILKEGDLTRLAESTAVEARRTAAELELVVSGLVAGSAHTLVIPPGDGAPRLYPGHLRPPSPGRAAVALVDLRQTRAPVRLAARASLSDSATLGADASGLSPEVMLEPGLFTVDWLAADGGGATADTLDLAPDRQYLLVVHDGQRGTPALTLMADALPARAADGRAYVRIADLRSGGPPSRVRTAEGAHVGRTNPEAGETLTGLTPVPAALPPIFLGKALADRLRAKVGDTLSFVTILRTLGMAGFTGLGPQPSSIRFELAGIFESGFYEQDVSLAVTNLRNSERFLGSENVVEALAVKTEDILTLDRTRQRLERALDPMPLGDLLSGALSLDRKLVSLADMQGESPLTPPSAESPFLDGLDSATRAVDLLRFQGAERAHHAQFQLFDWRDKNANHLSVIELQKIVLTIFFLIIVLVGSFVVVGSQIMIINEKTADIAILKTIGATGPFIRLVFTLQGLFVACVGVLFGLLLGLGGVWLLDAIDYELEASIYFIDRLPVDVDPTALVLVALGALATTLLTTQISAARAGAREPVEGLRQVD